MRKITYNGKETYKYNYCVICGLPLRDKQIKCCSKECNGKRYNTLIKVRAIRLLISDGIFKHLLTQIPLDLLVFGHVHNDGWQHRKDNNIQTGTQTYIWINNNPIEAKEIFEVVSYRSNMMREIESYENKVYQKLYKNKKIDRLTQIWKNLAIQNQIRKELDDKMISEGFY